jgi:hypothetical protein
VPATPSPDEGVGDVIYADSFDGRHWFWGFSDDAASFGIDEGVLKAVMDKPEAWWRFSVGPDDVDAGDQRVSVTTRAVRCGPADELGLIFRAREREADEGQFEFYVLKLNCAGAVRLEAHTAGDVHVLNDWTPAAGAQAGAGVDNTLTVWMRGSELRAYVNGDYVFTAHDDRLASGNYGFYLDDQTAGGLSVTFDNLEARAVGAVAGN